MTFHRFTLFRLFGMSVRGDIGWLFIAGLVTWSLTAGVFPFAYPGHTAAAYLVMGIIGAAGLFASILFHEFSHALVARAHGIEMQGITLWIFGGVAETSEEPDQPRSELKIAAIGPASSFVLGASFLALDVSGYALGWSTKITGVLDYLTWANLALAIFNLIPAFPLDGGRILRALIWARSRNLVAATRTASTVGSGFGAGLMLLGVLAGFGGNIVGGVWWILIGSFLRSAARGSFEQLLVREALSHATVRTLMDAHPPTVQADTTVEDFVSNFVLARGGAARVPVAEDGALVGFVDVAAVRRFPKEEWNRHTVRELLEEISEETVIPVDADANEALRKLERTGQRSLLVTDDGHVQGVLSVEDLVKYAATRMDLEDAQDESPRP